RARAGTRCELARQGRPLRPPSAAPVHLCEPGGQDRVRVQEARLRPQPDRPPHGGEDVADVRVLPRQPARARARHVHEQGAPQARGVPPARGVPLGPDRGRGGECAAGHNGGRRAAAQPRGDGSHPQRGLQAPSGGDAMNRRAIVLALAAVLSANGSLAPSGQLTVAAHGLEEPRGLATTDAGLLIAETKAGRVLRLEPSGALTILASRIRNPRALAAAPDGTIYIAARGLALAGREDNDEEDDDQDDEGDDHDVILHRDPATGAVTVVATQLRKLEGLALNGAFLYAAARRVDGLALVQGAIVRYPVLPARRLGVPGYFLASGFEDRPK